MYKLSPITLFLVLFVALPVFAGPALIYGLNLTGPFLVCDPNQPAEKVDKYEVKFNGQDSVAVLPDPTRQYGFKYDLTGKPNGSYTARARAYNASGWGAWSTVFTFSLPHNR